MTTHIYASVELALAAHPDWPWRYFHPVRDKRMACECCGRVAVIPAFMDRMDRLREVYGHPIVVASWYRCPRHNAKVSKTGLNGPHTTGRAVDVPVYGKRALKLFSVAEKLGFFGVGAKQHGVHAKRFLHVDDLEDHDTTGPRPWLWTYEAAA